MAYELLAENKELFSFFEQLNFVFLSIFEKWKEKLFDSRFWVSDKFAEKCRNHAYRHANVFDLYRENWQIGNSLLLNFITFNVWNTIIETFK